jgi:bifunctional non-homologous end joining protein LigD
VSILGVTCRSYRLMFMGKLSEYRRKRHFSQTPEPSGPSEKAARTAQPVFVVQKHAATRLHYDLRLEVDGVLKSWAVPKGPSLSPDDKRLAIQVEDHPFEYRTFEGVIPKGQYGGGEVIIWDEGTYEPEGNLSTRAQLARGELKFTLHGKKLAGSFVLVQLKNRDKKNEWLLIKHRDSFANSQWNAEQHAKSVASGRTLEDVALARPAHQPQRIGALPGTRKSPMPGRLSLTLATLVDKAFSDPQWLFEVKWDGIRSVAYIEKGKYTLRSRTHRDITPEYPEFRDLTAHLDASTAILDGEIVALNENGKSNFQKLQNRSNGRDPAGFLCQDGFIAYYIFDLLYCDGYDLRQTPLRHRKELLRQILRTADHIRFSEHQIEKGKELFEAARKEGLEGIIGKKIDSPYPGDRTSLWAKLKIVKELDAVVAGWTAPRRTRQYFGALVLGLYDKQQLRFIGSVGTGFNEATQKSLYEQLKTLHRSSSVFHPAPKLKEPVEWVGPRMVVRVKYANWTDGKHLRAPVFLGIRKDADPKDCNFILEQPAASTKVSEINAKQHRNKTPAARGSRDGVAEEIRNGAAEKMDVQIDGKTLHLTHLNKIYFPDAGIKKRELIAYYYRMAHYILPFLRDRPLVLRRYPNGIAEKAFFQKEAPPSIPDWIERAIVYSEERDRDMPYVMANDRASLIYLTNLGCIDHNPWSSRSETQDAPDYVFFDLDPTPGTPFGTVLRIARSIYEVLRSIRLHCFLKTSGASGFHIYVPLTPRYTYEQARTFAEVVGRIVAEELPDYVTFERTVSKRPPGRVLIDALQNARGKPLACVYSARAFPGAPVSAPISPDELSREIAPSQWNINTMEARIREVGDLWKDFWSRRQNLVEALDLLGRKFSNRVKTPSAKILTRKARS